jgi:uncharacterized protein (TIRG00374 family)
MMEKQLTDPREPLTIPSERLAKGEAPSAQPGLNGHAPNRRQPGALVRDCVDRFHQMRARLFRPVAGVALPVPNPELVAASAGHALRSPGAPEIAAAPRARRARGPGPLLRAALGVAAGVLLLFLFLRLVNVSAALRQLSHLRVGFALLCGTAFLAAYVVRAVRWGCLLSPIKVPIRRLVAIYQVATFLNWLLPVQAGELAKSLLLQRTDGVPVSRSLATVSMDKAMDLLPAVVLLALLPFVPLHLSQTLVAVLLGATALVVLGVLALALAAWRPRQALELLTRLLSKLLPERMRARIQPSIVTFLETLFALIRRPRVLLLAVGLTAIAVCLDALFCLLAFRAVGVSITPQVALYGYTLFNLAFMLPTPPGHIGSNEVMGLLIFAGVFGIGRSGVGAMFLFSHPWTAILMTTTGLISLSVLGVRFRSSWRMLAGAESR